MNNVKAEISTDGKELVLTIDLTKDCGLAKSGMTYTIGNLGNPGFRELIHPDPERQILISLRVSEPKDVHEEWIKKNKLASLDQITPSIGFCPNCGSPAIAGKLYCKCKD